MAGQGLCRVASAHRVGLLILDDVGVVQGRQNLCLILRVLSVLLSHDVCMVHLHAEVPAILHLCAHLSETQNSWPCKHHKRFLCGV